MPKLRLGINIDHVATVRNARHRHMLAEPDLLRACDAVLKAGADSITFHLREDRRHVMDQDVERLVRELKKRHVPVNLEIAATDEMLSIARSLKPEAICLVPEKRREVTTEGGLDVVRGGRKLAAFINDISMLGIRVSLFINADPTQVIAAFASGAAAIELHTGPYCESKGMKRRTALKQLKKAAHQAATLGLAVHAGHGLNFENVGPIAAISEIEELNIGHYLIGEAIFIGLEAAVRRMKDLMQKARRT